MAPFSREKLQGKKPPLCHPCPVYPPPPKALPQYQLRICCPLRPARHCLQVSGSCLPHPSPLLTMSHTCSKELGRARGQSILYQPHMVENAAIGGTGQHRS